MNPVLSSQASPAETLRPHKVLIVDDDPIILQTTSHVLLAAGYEVAVAVNCSEAITALRGHTPDVIMLDYYFPPDVPHGGVVSWDGLSLMQWLSSLKGAEKAHFIIISAENVAGLRDNPLAERAAAFFQKPIDSDQLLQTISSLC